MMGFRRGRREVNTFFDEAMASKPPRTEVSSNRPVWIWWCELILLARPPHLLVHEQDPHDRADLQPLDTHTHIFLSFK